MPSVLTGANLANRDLIYLGRLGRRRLGLDRHRPVRPLHAPRREHDLHRREQRRLRPHQGQFSATADRGSKAKRGAINSDEGIDLVLMALQLGATYVGRSFSGDKEQLVPAHQGRAHPRGAAFIDVISPCVAFNNHEGLDQELRLRARAQRGGEPPRRDHVHREITTQYEPGAVQEVRQHDGSCCGCASSTTSTTPRTASPR
jgi:2-oxoglutarate ferredoxin oxidoreductase subunit beta